MEKNQEPHVIFEQIGHATWLTLNRPQQRNPLSTNMMLALKEALGKAAENDQTRVVVIRANGSVFSAGHDLREISAQEGESEKMHRCRVKKILSNCANLMQSIMKNPKPIIASIQGPATAAGCQLVSTCDLAIASSESSFCTPGVNIGVFCTTPLVGVGRNIHRKHAMEMALTGDLITAFKAEQYGLVNKVVSPDDLTASTTALATKIASRSTQSIVAGKAMFYQQIEVPISDAFTLANETMLNNVTSKAADAGEGITAFIEKRRPIWEGL